MLERKLWMPGRWAGSGEVVLGSGSLELSRIRHRVSAVLSPFSLWGMRSCSEIRWTVCKPQSPVCSACWRQLRGQRMGWVSLMILLRAIPAASMGLLGEALLVDFCSCIAATPPYSVIPPTNCEVIKLSNTLGALQVGGSSHKLHLFLCDYIAICKGEQFPYLCVGFQTEVRASSWAYDTLFFLSL